MVYGLFSLKASRTKAMTGNATLADFASNWESSLNNPPEQNSMSRDSRQGPKFLPDFVERVSMARARVSSVLPVFKEVVPIFDCIDPFLCVRPHKLVFHRFKNERGLLY
jgi:hypothetical protein